jgi:hypothetical protein
MNKTNFGKGLEKLNDLTTQSYFNSTNKHSDFLRQIIDKRNRMEQIFVEDLAMDPGNQDSD